MSEVSCACGALRLKLTGPPLMGAGCCCNSCREASGRMAVLGQPPTADALGVTHFVMYRKDRVQVLAGGDALSSFRRQDGAKTLRSVATCCGTPVWLDFNGAHWLSLYAGLWPTTARPPIELHTMTGDLPSSTVLPDDVPNPRRHTARFMWTLLRAWAAMGFRSPRFAVKEALRV